MTFEDEPKKPRSALRWAVLCVLFIGFLILVGIALVNPKSPLSNAWNPLTPLNVQGAVTPLTGWKLRRALEDPGRCMAALETGGRFSRLPDVEDSPACYIRPHVGLSRVGQSSVKPLNTRCQTALRMAMWEQHGIQPAAQRHFGQPVREIMHLSSYSCRQMRTLDGGNGRMSTHATADSVDVSGFILADGQQITVLENWEAPRNKSSFLVDVADGACKWFSVTLTPEYNELHADHFHLQNTGWGLCR